MFFAHHRAGKFRVNASLWAVVASLFVLPALAFAQRDPNSFISLGTLNPTTGTLTINTDTLQITGAATTFTGVAVTQTGGPQIAVFNFANINIASGVTVNVTGTRALSLLSLGNITVVPNLSVTQLGYYGGYVNILSTQTGHPPAFAAGSGPGGGGGGTTGNQVFGAGAGYGGTGGNGNNAVGGQSHGNLTTTLSVGSGGGAGAYFGSSGSTAYGGDGGGAIEIYALGAVSVANVFSNGRAGSVSGGGGAGGGSGGGILIGGSSVTFTSLQASGGAATISGSSTLAGGGGGGGGRVLLATDAYTFGGSISGVTLNGGNTAGIQSQAGYSGVLSMDALTTTLVSGRNVTLNGTAVTSVAGSTTQTGHTIEAYVRKDLIINSGGTATLGMDNALRRLDSTGNNVTALTVNGTFNTGAYSQIVSTLSGSGALNLNTGGNLTVGENNGTSTFSGATSGNGSLTKLGSNTLTLIGAIGHTGSTTVQAGTLDFAPASGTQEVASPISGAGNLSKSGAGTTVLSGNNTYTGVTTIQAGTLRAGSSTSFGTNSAVTVSNGATFDLNDFSTSIGSLSSGGGTTGAVNLGTGTLSVGGDNTSQTYAANFATTNGNLVKTGGGTQVLSGTIGYGGTTAVNAGILQIESAMGAGRMVTVNSGGTLDARASIARSMAGIGPGGTITVGATGISLGDATNSTGFNHQGTLAVGANTVTLNSLGFAQLGAGTTLAGGTITAPNGVNVNGVLSGYGTVSGKFSGASGSTITASGGNLSLGGNVVGGFNHNGELNTGTNTVTINSTNRATLGTVTTLGSGSTAGTLTVTNGAFLDFGRAIQGFGTLNSTNTLAKAMIINGDVYGTSATERITFTGYVKGVGTFSNTTFNGTFAPGLSPTIVNTNNATFGSGSTLEIELGGTTPGSQHDKLIDSGTLNLNGVLKLKLINGYTLTGSETFNILQWNTLSGTFSGIDISEAIAPAGYQWDNSNLYVNGSISFTPVPEPAMMLALGAAGLGLAGWVRRRRAAQGQDPLLVPHSS